METIRLNNGLECPVIGLGTFMLSPAEAENSVREALRMGYSLVDTANAYVNERACGRGLRASGVARKDVFLSTKLWPSEYENPNAVDETLERLGTSYVDLLFIHQPAGDGRRGAAKAARSCRPSRRPPAAPLRPAGWASNRRQCPCAPSAGSDGQRHESLPHIQR